MKATLIAAAGLVATIFLPVGDARAATILTLDNPSSTVYQQTQNSPCVIGDPSCHNPAGFGQTTIPANTANYDLPSPTYTVGQIRNLVGDAFSVGIDVNTTTSPNATERLDLFTLSVNGVVQFVYDGASPGTTLVNANNGNGRSDELLEGFNLAGFLSTDLVVFRAIVNNATDGREEFFLVAANTGSGGGGTVPEPASMMIMGAGLAGLAGVRRRRAV